MKECTGNRVIKRFAWAALPLGVCLLGFARSVPSGAQTNRPELVLNLGQTGSVFAVAFSPNGKMLATGGQDDTVRVWDVQSGRLLRMLSGHAGQVASVAFSPDGRLLATAGGERGEAALRLYDPNSGALLRTLIGHSDIVTSVTFTPDGSSLLSGARDHTVRLWDPLTGTQLRTFVEVPFGIWCMAVTRDGTRLAISSGIGGHGEMRVYDLASGSIVRAWKLEPPSYPGALAFSSDGKVLFVGEWVAEVVRVWDVETGSQLRTIPGFSIANSVDGKVTAVGGVGADSVVRLFDSAGGERTTLKGHVIGVTSLMFSNDGTLLASGGADHTTKLWNLATGKLLRTLGHSDSIESVAYSVDGRVISCAGSARSIRQWDAEHGVLLRELNGHQDTITSIAYLPDRVRLVSSSNDRTVRIWDLKTGTALRTLAGHESSVNFVAVSPDGRRLASAGDDRTVRLWDVDTGNCVKAFRGHASPVWKVAFSPDGLLLASACGDDTGKTDGEVRLWDLKAGTNRIILQDRRLGVFSLAFSPNGTHLAAGGWELRESADGWMRIWLTRTGEVVKSEKYKNGFNSLVFARDGKSLVGMTYLGWLLWDLNNGSSRFVSGHTSITNQAALSRDGKTLATCGHDTVVKLWDFPSGRQLVTLKALPSDDAGLLSDYLAITPEGYYRGSTPARRYMRWRIGDALVPLAGC